MAVQVRGEFEVRVKEKGPLGLTMEPLTAPGLTNFASSLPHITAAAGQSADAFENGLPSLSADGKCCVIVGVRVRFGRSVRYVGLKSYEQWMRIVGQRVYANQVAGSVDTFAKLVCGYYAEDWGDSNSDSESDSSGASTSAMQCEQQDDDEVDDADAMQNEQQYQVNSDDSNEATSKEARNSNPDKSDLPMTKPTDRWSYKHFGRMRGPVGWRTAEVTGKIIAVNDSVITVAWGDARGKAGRVPEMLGTTDIDLEYRARGCEHQIREHAPPLVQATSEPANEGADSDDDRNSVVADDDDGVPQPRLQVMNMPTAHGPARDGIATGDVSEEEEDAFASDSGEDDAGVNDPNANVAMAGRACDEKYMKLGLLQPRPPRQGRNGRRLRHH